MLHTGYITERPTHRAGLCVSQLPTMSTQQTTIALEESTRNELFRQKESPEETYDDVIRSLLEAAE